MCTFFLFFFFKHKTAYEMRISDWSSDVCSSDLTPSDRRGARPRPALSVPHRRRAGAGGHILCAIRRATRRAGARGTGARSEEHTSELQSLMRISYAVFCLKKKNKKI